MGRKIPPAVEPPSLPSPPKTQTPLEYLLAVMHDEKVQPNLRLRAAIAAAQYVHVKRDDGGKKEERQAKAEVVATGKLAPAAPPRLAIVK